MPGAQRKPKDPAEGDQPEVGSDESGGAKFIRFTGHNGVRIIGKADWKAVGVDDQDAVTWDRTNAHQLPSADFSDKALNYLLNVDGEFKEVSLKES